MAPHPDIDPAERADLGGDSGALCRGAALEEPQDGACGFRQITAAHPLAKIMIVTDYNDADMRRAAREAGARVLGRGAEFVVLHRFLWAACDER